ncbi:MAG: terminase small subunit [Candidatus Sumerlaeota bacterium]|nr:terminase small subunit [Candidatus Sumerlaeota bacterium]
MAASNALTKKQADFVRQFLIDHNGTQAAIRAGYSARTAYSIGQRLLTKAEVRKAVERGDARRTLKAEYSAEIERTLTRYGATRFMYSWEEQRAVIGFELGGRTMRFDVPLPPKDAKEFFMTPGGRRRRSPADALKAWEQGTRQRWRALALGIKAKLEFVENGVTTLEKEFMAHICMPDDRTVSQHILPAIAAAYKTGRMQPLLPFEGQSHA